jgi:GT2 family glycosyltransferase
VRPGSLAASVVIPTRGRPRYLDVTLGTVMPQARALGAEVIVVSDGPDDATARVAQAHGATLLTLPAPRNLNAARNAGAAAAGADLIVYLDDDISAPQSWLASVLAGAESYPDVDAFGGPIRARLEGGGPRACGREPAPITTLDLGPDDRDAEFVWGANMAIRRDAFVQIGVFEELLSHRGDEEEWLRRLTAAGGRIRYLAAAGLEHRRAPEDATVRALSRAAFALGRTARRNDVRKGTAPSLRRELRVLAGCGWHTVGRRCAFGIVMGAHSAGRLVEARRPAPAAPADDFLSGTSGYVAGIRASTRAIALDALADGRARSLRGRLRAAADATPRRRVLVLGVERPDVPNVMAQARAELAASSHHVGFASVEAGARGKFENLNALLAQHDLAGVDWLLVLDDDVRLPGGFLDSFLFLAERFELAMAQPAHRFRSHAGWPVTRRAPGSVARETAFVEIGPVTAFAARTFDVLLPFPPLRAGWGLDAHWSALAGEHGWRIGVIDATPIEHRLRPVAAAYDRTEAIAEARSFLAGRPYTPASEAARTLVSHTTW